MTATTTARRVLGAALAAVIVAVALLGLLSGFSSNPVLKTLEVLAVVCLGAMVVGGAIVSVLVYLADWKLPASDEDFELIVERAEALAAHERWGPADEEEDDQQYSSLYGEIAGETEPQDDDPDAVEDAEFRALVRAAIDELPIEFAYALEHVAIVVSDGGAAVSVGNGRHGAYGLYQGDTVARDYFHDRIVIFRDTLTRDFGHDPELLRQQVVRTVRHELAHHLGYGEDGVRRLGL